MDWLFKGLVTAVLIWAIKGYIMEKLRRRRADDQDVTMGELKGFCREERAQCLKGITEEFKRGNDKFEGLDKKIESTRDLINKMAIDIAVIATEIKRRNGS